MGTVSDDQTPPAGWDVDEDGWLWRAIKSGDASAAPRHGFISHGRVVCKFTADAKAFDGAAGA